MAGMLSFCSSVIRLPSSNSQLRHVSFATKRAADAAKSVSEGKMKWYEDDEMPNNYTCNMQEEFRHVHMTYICMQHAYMYACKRIMYLEEAIFENQLTQHPASSCHYLKPKTLCFEVFCRTSRSRGGGVISQCASRWSLLVQICSDLLIRCWSCFLDQVMLRYQANW